MTDSRASHWNDVYEKKREDEVSWFQAAPAFSLELIDRCALSASSRIVDVGGGASRLVDALLDRGFDDLSVLDVSAAGLAASSARLGERAARVHWLVQDVTTFHATSPYALWHDRAVFHFLTEPEDRAAYARALALSVAPGGYAIVGAFAPDGPDRCSGLPVVRYDAQALSAALGPAFGLLESARHEHVTPAGRGQAFTFVRVRRA